MANRQRLVLLGLAVLVAVVAIVLIGGGGDDEDVIDTRTAPSAQTTPAEAAPTDDVRTNPPAPKRPAIPTVVVRDGEPVGGAERLRFRKGGKIAFYVRSDAAGHVHLHGYDLLKDLAPGKRVRFEVDATIDGRFEVELEDTGTLIAEVEVVP